MRLQLCMLSVRSKLKKVEQTTTSPNKSLFIPLSVTAIQEVQMLTNFIRFQNMQARYLKNYGFHTLSFWI